MTGKSVIPVCLALAVAVGFFRFRQFADFELPSDYAFFVQWIRRLAEAERFFPVSAPGQAAMDALMGDNEAALNILLRQIYQTPSQLFVGASVFV